MWVQTELPVVLMLTVTEGGWRLCNFDPCPSTVCPSVQTRQWGRGKEAWLLALLRIHLSQD